MRLILFLLLAFPVVQATSIGVSPGRIELNIGDSSQIRFFNPNDKEMKLAVELPKHISSDTDNITISPHSTSTMIITAERDGSGLIKILVSDDNSDDISLSTGVAIPADVRSPQVLESPSKTHIIARPFTGLAITGSIVAVGMAIFGIVLLSRSMV